MNLKNIFLNEQITNIVDVIDREKKKNIFVPITLVLPSQSIASSIEKELFRRNKSYINLNFSLLPILIKERLTINSYIDETRQLSNYDITQIMYMIIMNNKLSYFSDVKEFVSISNLFTKCILDLRLENPDNSYKEYFTSIGLKGEDILFILEQYEKYLTKNNLVDYPLLCQKFIDDYELSSEEIFIYFDDQESDYSLKEQECLNKISSKNKTIKISSTNSETRTRILEIKSAPYERLEVKEVFRDIIKLTQTGVTFDSIAVVCSNNKYLDMFYHFSQMYKIPCYFADGILPSTIRGLDMFKTVLNLISSDFEFKYLERYIQLANYFPTLKKEDENDPEKLGYSKSGMVRAIRKYGVPSGFNKWIETIKNCIDSPAEKNVKDYHIEPLENVLKILESFTKFMDKYKDKDVLAYYWKYFIECNDYFLKQGYEKNIIRNVINSHSFNNDMEVEFEFAANLITEPLDDFRKNDSNPYGKIMVTTNQVTGVFDYIFTLGFKDGNYPKKYNQNPILLDSEKVEINEKYHSEFKTIRDRAQQDEIKFGKMVQSANVKWTGYFSSMDVFTGKEQLPSFYYMHIYESIQSDEKIYKSFSDFLGKIQKSNTILSDDILLSLSEWEYDSKKLLSDDSSNKYLKWLANNKSILRTYNSDVYKWQIKFNEYSGIINKNIDKSEVSGYVTLFEKFIKCPYSFWLKNDLKLKPIERPSELNEMDNLFIGNVVHSFLEKVMKKKNNTKIEDVSIDTVKGYIEEAITEELENDTFKIPELEDYAIKLFLEIYEKFKNIEIGLEITNKPKYFEKEFGRNGKPELEIPLNNGKLLIRGIIDRIDECGDAFHIIDYKTSKNDKYTKKIFDGGKLLQHFFYAEALKLIENIQNKKIETGFFLLPKGKKDKENINLIKYSEDIKMRFYYILEFMLELINKGHYYPTGDCEFCDYTQVCGRFIQRRAELKFKYDDSKPVQELNAIREYK